VLHAGAAELAGDLAGALARHGLEARRVTLYETRPVTLSEAELKPLLRADTVLLHSPRGARALAQILRAHPAANMRALGLSPAILKPLARVKMAAKICPPFPLEAALLQLIDKPA
jgi:uroporphyrinogen-III synthase